MTQPVYWDRVMASLHAAVVSSVPVGTGVLWEPSEAPREAQPSALVTLSVISGVAWDDAPPSKTTRTLPATATLTLTGDPGFIILRASGAIWRLDGSGDAETDRDALLALISEATAPAVNGKRLYASPVAVSTDQISLTADHAVALFGLSVAGPISLAINTTDVVKVSSCDALIGIGVQAWAKERYPYGGAQDLAGQIAAGLVDDDVITDMGSHGVELATLPTDPAPLDAISGALWESRAAMSLDVRVPFVSGKGSADRITSTTGSTFIAKGNGPDITVQIGS